MVSSWAFSKSVQCKTPAAQHFDGFLVPVPSILSIVAKGRHFAPRSRQRPNCFEGNITSSAVNHRFWRQFD